MCCNSDGVDFGCRSDGEDLSCESKDAAWISKQSGGLNFICQMVQFLALRLMVSTFCCQSNGVEFCSQSDGVDLCSQSDGVDICSQSDGVDFQSQFDGVEFCPGVVDADFCSEAHVSDVELSRILVTVSVRVLSHACEASSAPNIWVPILSLVQNCV